MDTSVQLLGVTKRFGDVEAVRSLDLDIARGEFFTLLGPSGCGKTTTLRVIAGFEEPDTGKVLIDGADVEGLPPFRRPTNTVFQSYALFPHLSVHENVAFGLKRKGVPRDEMRNAWGRSSSASACPPRRRESRASSREASSSASRLPARSSTGPACCSSTSRSERST